MDPLLQYSPVSITAALHAVDSLDSQVQAGAALGQ